MLAVTVDKSIRTIISSKRKVFEIQQVIVEKKIIKKDTLNPTCFYEKEKLKAQAVELCKALIEKLNFIESCLNKDTQYIIINLLKHDRFQELSMREIYDELYQNFEREILVPQNGFSKMSRTG